MFLLQPTSYDKRCPAGVATRKFPERDLTIQPYFVLTDTSLTINPGLRLLLAALLDIIICSITKMALLIPSPAYGRTLYGVF